MQRQGEPDLRGGWWKRVNQACAAGNLRFLWSDEITYQQLKWVIAGGDTVIVAPSAAGYNTGLDQYPQPWLPNTCNGDVGGCMMPSIPSGSASQHTRILGSNYASCRADSAKTFLNASWGTTAVINVLDSQFVDVACFEIHGKDGCGGNGNFTNHCTNQSNGSFGVFESALTSTVNYTDMFIHGLTQDGIHGATGVGVVADHLHIRAMPNGGINVDDGA